jgi:hypothetical protein
MRAYVWLLAGVLVLAGGVVQAQDTPTGGEVYRTEHTQARGGLGVRQDTREMERRGYEEGYRRGYQRSLDETERARPMNDPTLPLIERPEDVTRGGFGGGQMRIPFGEGQEALPGVGQEEQLRRYEEGFARGYEEGRIRAQEGPDVERRLDQDRRMMEQRDRGVLENGMRQQPRTDQPYGTETRGGFGGGATMSPWGGTQDQQRGYDPYGPEGQRDFGTQQDQQRRFDQQTQPYGSQQDRQWQDQQQFDQQRGLDQQRGFDQQTQPYGTQQEQPRFDEEYSQRYGAEQQNEFGTQQEQQRGFEQETQPYGTQQDRQWQDQQTQPYSGTEQPRAGEQLESGQQTFTGTVDKAGDMYVLIVNGRAYELEADEEETVRNMVGQQVDVRGTLEDRTIQAESINPSAQGIGTPGAQQ